MIKVFIVEYDIDFLETLSKFLNNQTDYFVSIKLIHMEVKKIWSL